MKKPLPPFWFLLAIVTMIALHNLLPVVRWLDGSWRWLGAAPIAVGFGLVLEGNLRFRRAGTTVKPFQQSSALVTAWPFSFTRNPMYLGLTLILAGIGIAQGSLAPIAVIPLFIAWITVGFIRIEERMMEETFGAAYRDYRRRVRR